MYLVGDVGESGRVMGEMLVSGLEESGGIGLGWVWGFGLVLSRRWVWVEGFFSVTFFFWFIGLGFLGIFRWFLFVFFRFILFV